MSGSAPARRPRVAYFSPLSPVESGISFYSEDLLPYLAPILELDVYVDGYQPAKAGALGTVRVRDAKEFDRQSRARPYSAVVYQFGNSPAHAYMYARALREPGVVVLHDVVLHHLRLWMAVHQGRKREYTDTLARLYGDAGRDLARLVFRGQMPSSVFDYPMVEELLDVARAVVVHSVATAAKVRALRPALQVHVVPMGVPIPELGSREEARKRLGVPTDTFVVLSLGHVTPNKRLDIVLRAFHRLAGTRPNARFVIAGSESSSPRNNLARTVEYLGLGGHVEQLGFVAPALVDDLLAAADCCVNLRYPSAGETSASLLRMMGSGLPVIVTAADSFDELPDAACLKVRPGAGEEATVAAFLTALATDEALRASIGRIAREYVATEHSLERAASGYLAALGAIFGEDLGLAQPVAVSADASAGRQATTATWSNEVGGSARDVAPASASPALEWSAGAPVDDVARALVELELAGSDLVERGVARDLAALGLGVQRGDSGGATGVLRGWRRRWRRS